MLSSPSSLPASPLGSQQHSGARSCVDFQSVLSGSLPALLFYNPGKGAESLRSFFYTVP